MSNDNFEDIQLDSLLHVKEKEPIKTCSIKTRVWCIRMSVLLIISMLLMSMIITTWNYYSGLISDMDTLSMEKPFPVAMFDKCNNRSYNLDVTMTSDNVIFSLLDVPEQIVQYFVITNPPYVYELNKNAILFNKTIFDTCSTLIVWGIV